MPRIATRVFKGLTMRTKNGFDEIFSQSSRKYVKATSRAGVALLAGVNKGVSTLSAPVIKSSYYEKVSTNQRNASLTEITFRNRHVRRTNMLDAIRQRFNETRNAVSVKVQFYDRHGTPAMVRQYKLHTSPANDADYGIRLLKREIEKSMEAPVHGSDIIGDQYDLNDSEFVILVNNPPVGNAGTASKTGVSKFFKIRDYTSKDGDCLFACLKPHAPDGVGSKARKQFKTVRNDLNLPDDGVELSQETINKLCEYYKLNVVIFDDDATHELVFNDSPLTGNHTTVKTVYTVLLKGLGSPDQTISVNFPTVKILYQHAIKHYSNIEGELPLYFCPITGTRVQSIVVNHKTIPKPMEQAEIERILLSQNRAVYAKTFDHKPKPKTKTKTRILIYDIETTYNIEKEMGYQLEPYAVGWAEFKADAGYDMTNLGVNKKDGPNCLNAFLDYIAQAPEDVRYIITSFNGARFDNFMLAQAAAARDMLHNVFYGSSMLRSLQIGRHDTLDLCKLCPMSLNSACKAFNTSPKKQEGFSHVEIQEARNCGKFDAFYQENRAKILSYLQDDVRSTASLLVLLNGAMVKMGLKSPLLGRVQTIGGASWDLFKSTFSAMDVNMRPIAVADAESDAMVRKAIVGGRTQLQHSEDVNGSGKGAIEINAPLAMVDVCSLYPTVMSGAQSHLFAPELMYGCFPTGIEKKVDGYVQGVMGIYRVKVISQPKPAILPQRSLEDESLNWAPDHASGVSFETYTTNVSIELIRKHGGQVEVYEGLVWESSSKDLFKGVLEPLITEKSRQDKLKEDKDPTYNEALRETSKLCMNSLSGKCLQRNFDDLAIFAKGSVEHLKAKTKMTQDTDKWHYINGDYILITGKKKDFAYDPNKAKPAHIGVFIYEFARMYMYETLYSKYPIHYTDTDSALMYRSDYEHFRQQRPELNPGKTEAFPNGRLKVLGDLEDDLKEYAGMATAILIAPKFYYVKAGKTIKSKIKGVSQHSDKLILDSSYLEKIEAMTGREHFDTLYKDNEMTEPIVDAYNLFKRKIEGKPVNLLTSTLVRKTDGGFALEQEFRIKTI